MIGIPMPPTPDEPRYTQRQDECQAWDKSGLDLGEGTPEQEHAAATRAAVDIARLQGGLMGDESNKIGMLGPDFDAALSRHLGLNDRAMVFMAATELEHVDPEEIYDHWGDQVRDLLDQNTISISFESGVMMFGIKLPNGEERYHIVALTSELWAAMRTSKEE